MKDGNLLRTDIMKEKKIRVGLSGVTGIAQMLHLPTLMKLPTIEISAIYDKKYDRASKIADRFRIPHVFSDYQKMIGFSDIDIIDICSPVNFHLPEAILALKNGKHVLIEKPFAQNTREAEQIVDTAHKHQRKVMASMNLKFRPDAIALKSILNNKNIGNVFLMKGGWLRRIEKWQQKHVFSKNEQGVIMHLGLQIIDLGLWLLNNPKIRSVKALSYNRIMQSWVEDTAMIMLHLQDDAVFNIEVGWNMKFGKDFLYMNMIGDKGCARMVPFYLLTEKNKRLVNMTPSHPIFRGEPYYKSYENEFSHFIFCLLNDQELQSSGEEIIERFRIMEAIYKSIETGSEVVLI